MIPRSLIDRLAPIGLRNDGRGGVLLVSAGGLGDTVLFSLVLPRMTALAKRGEKITMLLRREGAKMAFLFPPEVTVEAVDFARLKDDERYRFATLRQVRAAGYRLAISTDYLRHPLLDEALIKAADAEESLAMEPRPWPKWDRLLQQNRALYDRLFDSGTAHRDKVLRWAAFADWLTGTTAPPPRVRLPEARLPEAHAYPRPTVLVQAFSAVTAKQRPPETYRALIKALPTHDFVFLGAPSDRDRNPDFVRLLDKTGFDTSFFKDLVPKLRGAELVISVDTALMHLAAAVGAKTLCLASAAYVGEIVPYAPEVTPPNLTVLHYPMPCQGCLGACIHPLEDGMYPCLACLDDGRIVQTAKKMLGIGAAA